MNVGQDGEVTHFRPSIFPIPNTLVNLCLSFYERVPAVSFITIVPMLPAAARLLTRLLYPE